MKGIEIARKLNISTSALKHYEAWGLIPKVERAENGYRDYTKEHEAYFLCIRAMNAGFGMALIRKVMPRIRNGEILGALWLINKAQVNLHAEREAAQRAVDMLDLKELTELPKHSHKNKFTIGEVAKEANVSASAIRHWEKEDLIRPERDKESGFRMYNPSDIRKVLIIRTVQRSAYSLNIVREVLSGIDNNNSLAQVKQIARESLQFIDKALIEQIRGIAALHHLLDVISKKEEEQEIATN